MIFSCVSIFSACLQIVGVNHGLMASWWLLSLVVNDELEFCSIDFQGGLLLFKENLTKPLIPHPTSKPLHLAEAWLMSGSLPTSPLSPVRPNDGDNNNIN